MARQPLLRALHGYWDGGFRPVAGAATIDVVDPATLEIIAAIPALGAAEARAAVDSAARALATPPSLAERERILLAIADAHDAHRDALAAIITAENGKPLREARGEVDYAAAFYRDAASRVPSLRTEVLPTTAGGHRWHLHHRPAGVAAMITPWNFPLAMLAKKLSAALAAGCPAVIKPAEKTPLAAIALIAAIDGLGLPPGMVNLVFGDAPAIGEVLCSHPAVRVLSFTGSTAVGKLLAAACAPHLKRLSLELGGNAPLLVFADADLDRAVDAIMANKFRCAGQTCVCINRVYVERSAEPALLERLRTRVEALVVGPGTEQGVDIGPLIDAAGFAKVRDHVDDALRLGARVVAQARAPTGAGGHFFAPTLLADIRIEMRCQQDETFGPVIAVATFDDEADAVARANDTPYGLAAYVFAGELSRAERVAARLHFGHVGVNTTSGPTPSAPFGGMGASGIGREGGAHGVHEFIELQTSPQPA